MQPSCTPGEEPFSPIVSGNAVVNEPIKIAYKFGRGPYQNVATFFAELHSLYPKSEQIGIYYDDPTVLYSVPFKECGQFWSS